MKKATFGFLLFLLCFSINDLTAQSTSHKLRLWATYYYIPELAHSENGIELLNEKGGNTGMKLDSCDWCKAAIEGTVRIKKENTVHTLNYAGRSDQLQFDCRRCEQYKKYEGYSKTGKILWKLSSGYGKGVKNYHLVPFITIAVDSSVIPFGSVIYIPQAKGISYTNAGGESIIHDGYFFAGDTGSRITGQHIDVFIGTAKENPFDFITSNESGTFDAYLQSDQKIILRLKNLHQ